MPGDHPWIIEQTKGLADRMSAAGANPDTLQDFGRQLTDDGNALIFARTETKAFFSEVWNKANAVLFIEGRLYFHHADGIRASANAGAPSVLVAYGYNNVQSLKNCGIKGKFFKL